MLHSNVLAEEGEDLGDKMTDKKICFRNNNY
jgi:hypothetical protein